MDIMAHVLEKRTRFISVINSVEFFSGTSCDVESRSRCLWPSDCAVGGEPGVCGAAGALPAAASTDPVGHECGDRLLPAPRLCHARHHRLPRQHGHLSAV